MLRPRRSEPNGKPQWKTSFVPYFSSKTTSDAVIRGKSQPFSSFELANWRSFGHQIGEDSLKNMLLAMSNRKRRRGINHRLLPRSATLEMTTIFLRKPFHFIPEERHSSLQESRGFFLEVWDSPGRAVAR